MGIRKPVLSVQEARRLSSLRPMSAESDQSLAASPPPAAAIAPVEQPTQEKLSTVSPPPPLTQPARPDAVVTSQPKASIEPKAEVYAPQRTGAESKPTPAVEPRVRSAYSAAPMPSIARIQVFISANVPLPGVSRSFDLLSRQYPPEKALQMILRRAMDDYEESLSRGRYEVAADSYPLDSDIVVYTSRMMPRHLLALARDHFDPLGFESARAFGQKLANAALTLFFAAERKKSDP
jgi:VirC2 protein